MTSFTNSFSDASFTVLLVGNNLGTLKQISFALQHRGYSIIWGDLGAQALQIVECERPGLVICETVLPDTSGFEVCRTIKHSCYFDLPVVLVGRLEDESAETQQALSAGADEYFSSVADWELILAKLGWFVKRRASSRTPAFSMAPTENVFEDLGLR